MLKKTDVYTYIEKVQRKAINSVQEKYDLELEKAISIEMNKKENQALKQAIIDLEKNIKDGSKARNIIKKNVPKFDKWNSIFNETDCLRSCFWDLNNFPNGFDEIKNVHVEYIEKLKRVNEEYAKIMRVCRNKKTGDQGKTALIALGFDVTWLNNLSSFPVVINETEFKIDKSLVFPCGETGL